MYPAIVGRRCKEGAELGMSPANTPNRSFVPMMVCVSSCTVPDVVRPNSHSPLQCLCKSVLVSVNFKDLDRFVARACRQSSAIVVQYCIVLQVCRWLAYESPKLDWRRRREVDIRSYHRDRSPLLSAPVMTESARMDKEGGL